MGCTPSSEPSMVDYYNNENNNSRQKGEFVMLTSAPGYRESTPKMRGPGTGSAAPKRYYNSNGDTMTEENGILQIEESAEDRPLTGEEGDFILPEEEFGDGRLGITDEAEIENLLEDFDGNLFVDSDFPPLNSSIYVSDKTEVDVKWLRPHEIVENPQLFVDGASRRDVVQGALGDCWFLSSCAAIARKPKLIERVIPPDQVLCGPNYRGIIICKFWRFGTWVTVCIDDQLPTKNKQLIFARSGDDNEFWVALIEKAYAKLHGSYETLEGGQSMDAMVDLTEGLAERYDIEEVLSESKEGYSPKRLKKKLYRLILKSSKHGAFITSSRKGDWRMAYKTDENGLVEGHAYTVSSVARVRHKTMGVVNLIRIRNPWGNGAEWSGGWGDGHKNWDGISEDQREKIGCSELVDGEFWMNFDDFCKQFEEVSICTLGPDFDKDGKVDHVGEVKTVKGEWIVGKTAGGSRNDFEMFSRNPQYLLTIYEHDDAHTDDEEDSSTEDDPKTSVLIALMQEYRRSKRDLDVKKYQIAFLVYKTDDGEPLPVEHFMYNYETGTSGTYINCREVLTRLELKPGNYVIIPATFNPDNPGTFMVRVYSPKVFSLRPLTV